MSYAAMSGYANVAMKLAISILDTGKDSRVRQLSAAVVAVNNQEKKNP